MKLGLLSKQRESLKRHIRHRKFSIMLEVKDNRGIECNKESSRRDRQKEKKWISR
jgi:hypothetical protein